VKCWGAGGLLGDNTQISRTEPVTVLGLTNVAALDAGQGTTCAILGDGTVKCWGYNSDGQIGDNSKVDRLVPVTVPGLMDVIAIDNMYSHTCAAVRDGTVRCWGSNSAGQLGASNVGGSVLTPQGVSGVSGANGVATGTSQSCVILKSNGAVQCWGKDLLGDGSVSSSYTPVTAKNLDNVAEVVFGFFHACARQGDRTVRCWGVADLLGTGATSTDGNPSSPVLGNALSVGIGTYSTVAVHVNGGVFWWDATRKPAVAPGLSNIVAISHTAQNACEVHRDGSVSCWTLANGVLTTPTVVSGINVF
jgi:alpha-tubulin suppressor-like RCC1 family protein